MTSAPAIGFEYSSSRWLGRALGLMSVLAVVAILLAGLPFWLKYPLALVPLLGARQAILRLKRSPLRAAGWSRDGNWTLRFVSGDDVPATLASFRVMGDLIWLRLHTQAGGQRRGAVGTRQCGRRYPAAATHAPCPAGPGPGRRAGLAPQALSHLNAVLRFARLSGDNRRHLGG